MTRGKWAAPSAADSDGDTGDAGPDVVAGLVADEAAPAVARAAVLEAVARAVRVRFLSAVAPDATPDQRAHADATTFAAALRALRDFPRVPVSFEVAEGRPGEVFVDGSIGAGVLVTPAAMC